MCNVRSKTGEALSESRPNSAVNLPHVPGAVDRRDRQTDRQTDGHSTYRILRGPLHNYVTHRVRRETVKRFQQPSNRRRNFDFFNTLLLSLFF